MMDEQIEIQVRMANIQLKIEEQKETIKEIYTLAITQGMEDKLGIIAISIASFSKLIDVFTESCIEYGKLLGELDGE